MKILYGFVLEYREIILNLRRGLLIYWFSFRIVRRCFVGCWRGIGISLVLFSCGYNIDWLGNISLLR